MLGLTSIWHRTKNGERVQLEKRDFVRRGDVSNWLTSEAFDLKEPRSIEAEEALAKARDYCAGHRNRPWKNSRRLIRNWEGFWAMLTPSGFAGATTSIKCGVKDDPRQSSTRAPDFDRKVRQPGLSAIAELVGEPPLVKTTGRRRKKIAESSRRHSVGKFPPFLEGSARRHDAGLQSDLRVHGHLHRESDRSGRPSIT